MTIPNSSRSRYRKLFWLWCILGAGLVAAALSPQIGRMERHRQASEALQSAREALVQAKDARPASEGGEGSPNALFALAMKRASACISVLGKERPDLVVAAKVVMALVELESGRAFEALTLLSHLENEDRPGHDSPWTGNTPLIEEAVAETRYKIALMCKAEGDGFENWSAKYAEPAAKIYQELADRASTAKEKDAHLRNLATCTRLIHGNDESAHSLGFPACRTKDCARIARVWRRPPPNSPPPLNPDDKPWETPPEPNETTLGK